MIALLVGIFLFLILLALILLLVNLIEFDSYDSVSKLLERGKNEKAVATLRKILHRRPDDERCNLLLGKILYDEGKYHEALDPLETFLAIQNFGPETPERDGRLMVGRAYQSLGEEETAVPHMQRAWELKPSDTELAEELVEIFEKTSRAKRALEILNRWVKQEPDNPNVPLRKARLLLRAAEYAEAGEALKMAAALGANATECQLLAGELKERVGELDEAGEYYRRLLSAELDHKTEAEVRLRLGRLELRKDRPKEAAAQLERGIRLAGHEPTPLRKELLLQLGNAYSAVGSNQDAAVFWEQLYTLDPNYCELPGLVRLAPQKMLPADILKALLQISTQDFTTLGRNVLEGMGYSIVEETVLDDLSINFKVRRDDYGLEREKLVYLRRWDTAEVAQLPVQELQLAVTEGEYIGGIFMVNTNFSGSAIKFATATNILELMNGMQFANWIKRTAGA